MSGIKGFLKKKLTNKQIKRIIDFRNDLKAIGNRSNLTKLAQIYATDKWGYHFYTEPYQHYFKKYRLKRIKLLEIGIGGYAHPEGGGRSLRMWKAYFPFAKIYGLDLYDKSFHNEQRVKTFMGSQIDLPFLDSVCQQIGSIDLIIDDGSHINEHVITTFKHLFPKLKDGGLYVIEDTQTSYWKDYGGSEDLNAPHTIMNYFKNLTDCLNSEEFKISNYERTYFDKKIVYMHFYHNLIFIKKGDNNDSDRIDPKYK